MKTQNLIPCFLAVQSFLSHVNFEKSVFEWADFSGATFSQSALFYRCSFNEEADFEYTTFKKDVNFRRAEFNIAKFNLNKFYNYADFRNAKFQATVNFSNSTFSKAPMFQGSSLSADTIWHDIGWPKTPTDVEEAKEAERAWSTLKLLMNKVMRHEVELDFFAKELEARSAYKELGLSFKIYKLTSNLGRSILNPFISLIFCDVFFFIVYSIINLANGTASEKITYTSYYIATLQTSAFISFANSIPLVGLQKYIYTENTVGLIYILGSFQIIISSILIS